MVLDRLSRDDVRILRLEGGAIRGHTCKVLLLEATAGRPRPSIEQLREHIEARLDRAPRLRKRLVRTPLRVANPVWLDDPDFDIRRHVRAIRAEAPVSRAQLSEIVAGLLEQRLERSHPLWRMDVLEELDDGSMALVWRIHHCMADGTASLRLGSEVLWSEDPGQSLPEPSAWQPEATPRAPTLLAAGILDRLRRARRHPRQERAPRTRHTLHDSETIVKRELGRKAALTPLAHRAGPKRRIAFATASMDQCRHAAKAIDERITLNDVVLALIAGGVRAWMLERHSEPKGIRAKVPVSLHHRDEDGTTANRDGYFFVDLPVEEPDPAKRLIAINRETKQRKLDGDAETLYRLGGYPFVEHWARSPRVFTFNISNVRGPAKDVYVLGARVREMYSIAEIAERHALRAAVLSSAGRLFFGLCADLEVIDDLEVIAEGITRSCQELLQTA